MPRWIRIVLALVLTLAGCGSRALNPNAETGIDRDLGLALDVPVRRDAARRLDLPGARDLQLPDRELPPEPPAGPNSGQTCDQSSACPSGDSCLLLPGWTKGICLGQCTKQGDSCPTPSPSTLSVCAMTDQAQSAWYCLYVCEVQGQTYTCPDPATQDCVQSVTSGIKICRPK